MSQTLKLMTYNIRYDNPKDEINGWKYRKDKLVNQVNFYEPDIMGIQEGLVHQVKFLEDNLHDYKYIGVGRDDGKEKGEFAAIYYHTKTMVLLEHGTFWLSETPEEPSIGWDASMERICTYGQFNFKATGTKIWVFNAHYDHVGPGSRTNASKLILSKINELINSKHDCVVVMGDLNAEPGQPPIELLSNQYLDAGACQDCVVFGPEGTYNGFDINNPLDRRIDYIFVDEEKMHISKYAVLSPLINRKFISDHFPVYVEVIVQ